MNKEELIAHLQKKGYSAEVIDAFRNINRENFVPEHLVHYAYEDIALPIGESSALSQPSTIAFMLELLQIKKDSKVLEIGAGSGYVLSLISSICREGQIYGLEIDKNLAIQAKERLLSIKNVHILNKEGSKGLPDEALFDRILVSATFKEKPYHLLKQLTDSGILVTPVKDAIICIKKNGAVFKEEVYSGFSFVQIIDN